jgi:xanthine dehydrogenase small subunit
VVVGEAREGATRWRAVNSCIRFVGTLDGKEVVTVESLRAPGGALHPVQRAMVEAHASQCGFCTPGFVMSLFALWMSRESVTRDEAVEALAGNLCRCTGYRPIIDAAMRMHSLGEPSHWPRSRGRDAGRIEALPRAEDAVSIPKFRAPRTLEALAAAYAEDPGSWLLAGGTDIGLWVTKELRDLPPLIYVGDVPELCRIEEREGWLEVGAAVALTDAFNEIVKRHPALSEIANRFGSPPIRNSGTLCGNIANGSPIGDSMPALIALGAEVALRQGAAERVLPLENLYTDEPGVLRKALRQGEFVRAVRVPPPRPDRIFASYKTSKRFDQDISAVAAGFALTVRGGSIVEARVAYGGMARNPRRARAAEAALQGKPFTAMTVAGAVEALRQDFAPIDDLRGSAAYRMRVAGALLERFFDEHAPSRHSSPSRVRAFTFGVTR